MATLRKTLILVVPVVVCGFLFGFGCQEKGDTEMEETVSLGKKQMSGDMGRQFPQEMFDALKNQEHGGAGSVHAKKGHAKKGPVPVVVPPDVQGKWKAVVIGVANKQTNEREDYVVDINQDFIIPNTKIRIMVLTFLPDFSMSPKAITSLSNEPKNPAAKIAIYEDDKKIFGGWLFQKLTMIHPFEHEVYSVKLIGQKAA